MRRKHADLIHEWAEGAEVQRYSLIGNGWVDDDSPNFFEGCEYRRKPQPKPDVVKYVYATQSGFSDMTPIQTITDNIRIAFDGETGALKNAEVLK